MWVLLQANAERQKTTDKCLLRSATAGEHSGCAAVASIILVKLKSLHSRYPTTGEKEKKEMADLF